MGIEQEVEKPILPDEDPEKKDVEEGAGKENENTDEEVKVEKTAEELQKTVEKINKINEKDTEENKEEIEKLTEKAKYLFFTIRFATENAIFYSGLGLAHFAEEASKLEGSGIFIAGVGFGALITEIIAKLSKRQKK